MKRSAINELFRDDPTNSTYFKVNKKNELYCIKEGITSDSSKKILISDCFVKITDVLKLSGKESIIFQLFLKDYLESDVPFLKASITRTRKFTWHDQNEFLRCLKKNRVTIPLPNQLLEAYRIYIQAEIEEHSANKTFLDQVFGWKKFGGSYSYLGWDDASFRLDLDETFCQGDRKDSVESALNTVFLFMEKFPETLPLFAYLFYALGQKLLCLMEIEPNYKPDFFLALTGQNAYTSPAALANFILNLFDYDAKRPHMIKSSIHICTDSITNHGLYNNFLIQDVPLLVFNKKRTLKKSDPIVKTLLKNCGNSACYSVLITQSELRDPAILTLDISTIPDLKTFSEPLAKTREPIIEVVCYFIDKIKSRMIDCEWSPSRNLTLQGRIVEYRKKFLENEYADSDVEHYPSLYSALLLFFFIDSDGKASQPAITNGIRRSAFQILTSLSNCSQLPSQPYEDAFVSYLRAIFVDNTHKPSFEYWEGIERNGGEACYYLSYHDYFQDFSSFVHQPLAQREWNRLLLDRKMVKVRTDASAIGSYRKHNHKDLYTLVVFKHAVLHP